MYMLERRGGGVQYIKLRKYFKTLPRWDFRILAEFHLINFDKSGHAKVLEENVHVEAKDNLKEFGYQKGERKISEKDLDWETSKGKMVQKFKPIKIITSLRILKQ